MHDIDSVTNSVVGHKRTIGEYSKNPDIAGKQYTKKEYDEKRNWRHVLVENEDSDEERSFGKHIGHDITSVNMIENSTNYMGESTYLESNAPRGKPKKRVQIREMNSIKELNKESRMMLMTDSPTEYTDTSKPKFRNASTFL